MTTIRKETRKRGILGIVFRFLFYSFNICMILFLVQFWQIASDAIGKHAMPPGAGAGVGLLGTGMVSIAWLIGDGILGALVLMTRGTKIIIEERIN